MADLGALSSSITTLTRALEDSTNQYMQAAKDMNEMFGKGGRSERTRKEIDRNEQLKAAKKVNDEYENMYKALRQINAEQKEGTAVSNNARRQLKKSAQALSGTLGETSAAAIRAADGLEAGNAMSEETIKALSDNVRNAGRERALSQEAHTDMLTSQDQARKSLDKMADGAKKAADMFFSWPSAVGNITAGFVRSADELEFAMKHQSDMYSMLSMNMDTWAGKLGLAPIEMQKMVAEFRPLINSAQLATGEITSLSDSVGTTVKAMRKQYDGQQSLMDQAYRLTGNYADAATLVAENMRMLQGLGTAFNMKELGAQTSDIIETMRGFAHVTGESTEQQSKMLQQHLGSAEVQAQLLKLDKTRRAGRVQEILESVRYQAAQRGTVEAALEAEKALSKLAGMSTKDRFKEAAKMQAVAGGLGMQLDPRIMEIMRKPENMRTGEESKLLSGQMDQMSQAYTGARRQGGGTAMAAEAMFGKLSSEFQNMIMSQNTELSAGLKIDQQTFDVLTEQKDIMSKQTELMVDAKQFYDKTAAVLLKDPTAQILAGTVAGVGATAKSIHRLMMAHGVSGGAVGAAGRGARRGARSAAGAARGAVGLAGAAMGAAGSIASAGMVGWEIGTAINGAINEYAPEWGVAIGDGLGGAVDWVHGIFDSGFAEEKAAKEKRYKSEEEYEQKRVAEQEKVNALTLELQKQQLALQQMQLDALKTGNDTAVEQQEITIATTESQIAQGKKNVVTIARESIKASRG